MLSRPRPNHCRSWPINCSRPHRRKPQGQKRRTQPKPMHQNRPLRNHRRGMKRSTSRASPSPQTILPQRSPRLVQNSRRGRAVRKPKPISLHSPRGRRKIKPKPERRNLLSKSLHPRSLQGLPLTRLERDLGPTPNRLPNLPRKPASCSRNSPRPNWSRIYLSSRKNRNSWRKHSVN